MPTHPTMVGSTWKVSARDGNAMLTVPPSRVVIRLPKEAMTKAVHLYAQGKARRGGRGSGAARRLVIWSWGRLHVASRMGLHVVLSRWAENVGDASALAAGEYAVFHVRRNKIDIARVEDAQVATDHHG